MVCKMATILSQPQYDETHSAVPLQYDRFSTKYNKHFILSQVDTQFYPNYSKMLMGAGYGVSFISSNNSYLSSPPARSYLKLMRWSR